VIPVDGGALRLGEVAILAVIGVLGQLGDAADPRACM